MDPAELRSRVLTTWVAPVGARLLRLEPGVRAVVWAVTRDGEEALDDFVPCPTETPAWPGCVDDNPWLDDEGFGAALDEALFDAAEALPCPAAAELLAGWGDHLPPATADAPRFVPLAIVTRAGVRPWGDAG